MKGKLPLLFCCLLLLAGCRGEQEKEPIQDEPAGQGKAVVEIHGCGSCHPEVSLDGHHDFSCTACHKGNDKGRDKESAHTGLVAMPAHPDFMAASCGGCHGDIVRDSTTSLHFTLRNEVNRVHRHFGIPDEATGLTALATSPEPDKPAELVDDLLRRRCLRCHLYSRGDSYAMTRRGTGCAACHLEFSAGRLVSHTFSKFPGDTRCLSCHYGNFVGADYYGRYEHDFGDEFRTPFTTKEEFIRPYGVEYHELTPDVHLQRGLSCVDCHFNHRRENDQNVECATCHQLNRGAVAGEDLPPTMGIENGLPVLTARLTGTKHPVPQMSDPAHEKYGKEVSCQVCHAQWSFNDSSIHLLRIDTSDYEPLYSIQSSSTVENPPEENFPDKGDELLPAMPDTVTGRLFPGVWYKGFVQRRWEDILIRRDEKGTIRVFRPLLDLRLSYVNSDQTVIFDNLQGKGQALLPYTPHTTGKAGLFYRNRFTHLLPSPDSEKKDR